MDFEWTDGLCADLIEAGDRAQVNGGILQPGATARVIEEGASADAQLFAGRTVTVQEIAVGSKGKGAFRKRLWVALRVVDAAGLEGRVMATDLEIPAAAGRLEP